MEIRLENVTKTIRKSTVINHVSLTFSSGIISGLKGINGSGKTMLIRLLSGLIKPTSGKIYIDQKELWKDISFPESMGFLIENPAFLDSYSAFNNLKLLAGINQIIGDDEINDSIAKVGLDPKETKKYKYFSLGMKQRLAIAAAIMEKPDMILLDEPTNALDSAGIQILKDLLLKEKSRGALIILSCHDYGILRELSDEIYSIEEGEIKAYEAIK